MSPGETAARPTDLVGAGWAFPAGTTQAGGIALRTGYDSTDAAIHMILSTVPGERVMRPDFGCGMWDQLFAPMDEGTVGLVENAVREALLRWEPRIDVEEVRAVPEEEQGRLVISIRYVVRATNDERNLVYPFYLIPREEPSP